MQRIELVVFDMAGTTVNEDNVVYKTLQKAINKKGYDLSLEFVLEHGAGKEKHQAIKDILLSKTSEHLNELSEEIFEDFKIMLKSAYEDLKVTAYKGVDDLIVFLKKDNIKVALNTGYDSITANYLLSKMNWELGNQLDALVTADDVLNGRPHPDMIKKSWEILKITDSQKVAKVGDSIIDIEEGKNASCGVTIGVTTGAHTRAQLTSANPTYVLDSLSELKEILSK